MPTLLVAIAGCGGQPATPQQPPQAAALQAPPSQSRPFATALFDSGPIGRYFAAGDDEQVVIEDQAALDAFYARHARLRPGAPIPVGPAPASMAPPAQDPPAQDPPASAPPPAIEPLPAAATRVDFGAYRAIAVFDGSVELNTTTRITGVVPDGDHLRVETTRFVTLGTTLPADPGARVHVILLPRADAQPIAFAPIAEADGRSDLRDYEGALRGWPAVLPRWKAVPAPGVTREAVEGLFRRTLGGAATDSFKVELTTIGKLASPETQMMPYTQDSEIWLCEATGTFPVAGFSAGREGRPVQSPRVHMLVPVDRLETLGLGYVIP